MGKLAALSLVLLAGCSASTVAGGPDGGGDDTAAADAAVGPDAGYAALPPGCDDVPTDVWTTPAGLPPMTEAMRGDIVRCAPGVAMTAAEVTAQLDRADGVVPTTGVQILKIAYRTVRGDGSPTVTTATVFLPIAPRALPAPIALVARSTSGIADACAPSREDYPQHELALPVAARGFVVIAPDFAGLGNEGVHAYLDEHEAAAQLFDGAKALARLIPPGVLGDPEIALGYSQGGGIVLTAQALEQELTGGRTLRAIAAMAPQWPTRPASFGYEDVLRNPDLATGLAGLTPPPVTVLRHYGWAVNHLGVEHAGDTFPAAEREDLIAEIESDCTIELGAALGVNQPHLGDLVDEAFRVAMLACIDGVAGCVEPAASFYQWMQDDVVTADPAGADVLILQGLGDQIMPPATQASCDVAKLRAEGVEPTICSDAFATHDSILGNKIEHAIAWLEAAADGVTRPTCSSTYLPACGTP
jgi:hypothetical protein